MSRSIACLHALLLKQREIKEILAILPFRQKLRFLIRITRHPDIALAWLKFITSEPLCHCPSPSALYRNLQKPLQPYLNHTFSAQQRLQFLQGHFECLRQVFGFDSDQRYSAIAGQGLRLAVFSSKNHKDYALTLSLTEHFHGEGEFKLSLEDATNQKQIAVVAFSLGTNPKRRIYIGCLHGYYSGGVEFIRLITHDFSGIRPKNLLMFALYDLAEAWNIKSFRAIDNSKRINGQCKDSPQTRPALSKADYESFWKELGGHYIGNGWFKLPSRLKQKSPEKVRSKHREEHHRKLQLREQIRSQIQTTLACQAGSLSQIT